MSARDGKDAKVDDLDLGRANDSDGEGDDMEDVGGGVGDDEDDETYDARDGRVDGLSQPAAKAAAPASAPVAMEQEDEEEEESDDGDETPASKASSAPVVMQMGVAVPPAGGSGAKKRTAQQEATERFIATVSATVRPAAVATPAPTPAPTPATTTAAAQNILAGLDDAGHAPSSSASSKKSGSGGGGGGGGRSRKKSDTANEAARLPAALFDCPKGVDLVVGQDIKIKDNAIATYRVDKVGLPIDALAPELKVLEKARMGELDEAFKSMPEKSARRKYLTHIVHKSDPYLFGSACLWSKSQGTLWRLPTKWAAKITGPIAPTPAIWKKIKECGNREPTGGLFHESEEPVYVKFGLDPLTDSLRRIMPVAGADAAGTNAAAAPAKTTKPKAAKTKDKADAGDAKTEVSSAPVANGVAPMAVDEGHGAPTSSSSSSSSSSAAAAAASAPSKKRKKAPAPAADGVAPASAPNGVAQAAAASPSKKARTTPMEQLVREMREEQRQYRHHQLADQAARAAAAADSQATYNRVFAERLAQLNAA